MHKKCEIILYFILNKEHTRGKKIDMQEKSIQNRFFIDINFVPQFSVFAVVVYGFLFSLFFFPIRQIQKLQVLHSLLRTFLLVPFRSTNGYLKGHFKARKQAR